MEATPLFTGAFEVTFDTERKVFRLDFWRKPGRIGHAAPDVSREIKNGDPFEFSDFNGPDELSLHFRPFRS